MENVHPAFLKVNCHGVSKQTHRQRLRTVYHITWERSPRKPVLNQPYVYNYHEYDSCWIWKFTRIWTGYSHSPYAKYRDYIYISHEFQQQTSQMALRPDHIITSTSTALVGINTQVISIHQLQILNFDSEFTIIISVYIYDLNKTTTYKLGQITRIWWPLQLPGGSQPEPSLSHSCLFLSKPPPIYTILNNNFI